MTDCWRASTYSLDSHNVVARCGERMSRGGIAMGIVGFSVAVGMHFDGWRAVAKVPFFGTVDSAK